MQDGRPWVALIPLAAGLAWLLAAGSTGLLGTLVCGVPGTLLVAAGAAGFLWAGDLRIPQFAAVGGLLGLLLALPAAFAVGGGTALGLAVASAAAFVAAGAEALREEPPTEEVPAAEPTLRLAAKVAADDVVLGLWSLALPQPGAGAAHALVDELGALHAEFETRGWLADPAAYHETPPPLTAPTVVRDRVAGLDYEHLSFESGYEPREGEPGRERWLSYAPNRRGHAWVLRHGDAPRPWLLCVHGYQMGTPRIDLQVLGARWLHHELGLNLVIPTLPLHGARKIGRLSGDGFLAGNLADSVHAEAQAQWDLRRVLGWVRAQGAPAVGAYGLSLGGYNTALLSGLEADLACAVLCIPLADIAGVFWRHGAPLRVRALERAGFERAKADAVLRPVSPLALTPRVPHERRALIGAVADRLVPAAQVRDLWRHWERPSVLWFQGSHLSFGVEPEVSAFVEDTLRKRGLVL